MDAQKRLRTGPAAHGRTDPARRAWYGAGRHGRVSATAESAVPVSVHGPSLSLSASASGRRAAPAGCTACASQGVQEIKGEGALHMPDTVPANWPAAAAAIPFLRPRGGRLGPCGGGLRGGGSRLDIVSQHPTRPESRDNCQ